MERCRCQVFYVSFGDVTDEDGSCNLDVSSLPSYGNHESMTSQEEACDTFTLLHHEVKLCANSVRFFITQLLHKVSDDINLGFLKFYPSVVVPCVCRVSTCCCMTSSTTCCCLSIRNGRNVLNDNNVSSSRFNSIPSKTAKSQYWRSAFPVLLENKLNWKPIFLSF